MLPLNLLTFSILKHHPLSSTRGLLRLLPVLLQSLLVLWLLHPEQKVLAEAFDLTYLDWLPSRMDPDSAASPLGFSSHNTHLYVAHFCVSRPVGQRSCMALGNGLHCPSLHPVSLESDQLLFIGRTNSFCRISLVELSRNRSRRVDRNYKSQSL